MMTSPRAPIDGVTAFGMIEFIADVSHPAHAGYPWRPGQGRAHSVPPRVAWMVLQATHGNQLPRHLSVSFA